MYTYSSNEYVYIELLVANALLKISNTVVYDYKTFRGGTTWSSNAAMAHLSKMKPIT